MLLELKLKLEDLLPNKKGRALIFSAPSGSGKTTIVKYLIEINPDLVFSISASTRPKRDNVEEDGKDYYFLTQEEFVEKVNNNEFIEWEEVYKGIFYGTLKSEVSRIWDEGKNVIFDVDVKGGINLKNYFGSRALAVFVKAPSEEILKERLVERNTESEAALAKRLEKAREETTYADRFDKILLNDDLERSLKEAQNLYIEFKEEKSS